MAGFGEKEEEEEQRAINLRSFCWYSYLYSCCGAAERIALVEASNGEARRQGGSPDNFSGDSRDEAGEAGQGRDIRGCIANFEEQMAAIVQGSSMVYKVSLCPLPAAPRPERAKVSQENAHASLSTEELDVELWIADMVGSIGEIVFVVIWSYLGADDMEFVAQTWGHH